MKREFKVIENGVEKMSFFVANRDLIFSFKFYSGKGDLLDTVEMGQHIDHIRDVCKHPFSVDQIAEDFMGMYRYQVAAKSNDIFDDLNVLNFIKSGVSCVMFPETIGFDSMKKDVEFFWKFASLDADIKNKIQNLLEQWSVSDEKV